MGVYNYGDHDQKDFKVDVFSNAVPRAVKTVRVVHIPTGIMVEQQGKSEVRARNKALKSLLRHIDTHERSMKRARELASVKMNSYERRGG